jgi:Tol biopolymer transport system component
MSMSRLTTSGKAKGAAISPDGKYVAYVKQDDGSRSLWLRQVGTTSDIQISSQIDAGGLVFSPDGTYLYYRNFFGDLSRMHVLGGASNLLLKGVSSSISFSPDGKRFAFLREIAGTEGMSLLVANADGTGEKVLASRNHPESFDQAVAWSPDGKAIACGVRHTDAQGTYMSVVQVQVESGKTEAITSERWLEVTALTWLFDGSGLLVMVAEQGSLFLQKIWKISYSNGEAHRLTNDLGTYNGLSMTADSKTLVTLEEGLATNIWVMRDAGSTTARQVTTRTGMYLGVSWTPDGRLVYSSDASGNWNIWTKGTSEDDERQLTSNQNASVLPSVSPDGRQVLFTSNRLGNFNIWRMDIDGGNARQLTHGNYDYASSWSPDGRWVVYVHQTSGRPSVWKVSIDGGQPVQLSNENSESPVFSPDGKLIACSYGNNKVALIPADGGQPLKTFDIPTPLIIEPGFQWTPDGRALTYVDTRGGVSNIWSQPMAGGPPKQITDFKSDEILSFALSRDGQFAISRGMETGDVVLITNLR